MAHFEVGDAQKLSFGEGTFDVAIIALVLSFLPDPSKAVAEMVRVTRSGGWVATYMWDVQGGGSPTTAIYAAIESLGLALPVRPNPAASRLEDDQNADCDIIRNGHTYLTPLAKRAIPKGPYWS
jgi:SAM-dependent methyltransferase